MSDHQPRIVHEDKGWRATCTRDCCRSYLLHDSHIDALDEARGIVARQEHGPAAGQERAL